MDIQRRPPSSVTNEQAFRNSPGLWSNAPVGWRRALSAHRHASAEQPAAIGRRGRDAAEKRVPAAVCDSVCVELYGIKMNYTNCSAKKNGAEEAGEHFRGLIYQHNATGFLPVLQQEGSRHFSHS